nr:MAG TPA: hypothetical protein [Caudoviricetes sp.]
MTRRSEIVEERNIYLILNRIRYSILSDYPDRDKNERNIYLESLIKYIGYLRK